MLSPPAPEASALDNQAEAISARIDLAAAFRHGTDRWQTRSYPAALLTQAQLANLALER